MPLLRPAPRRARNHAIARSARPASRSTRSSPASLPSLARCLFRRPWLRRSRSRRLPTAPSSRGATSSPLLHRLLAADASLSNGLDSQLASTGLLAAVLRAVTGGLGDTFMQVIRIFLIPLCVTLYSSALWAQQGITSATVGGRVEDATGARLPRAPVRVQNLDRNQTWTAGADDEGRFQFLSLPVGAYELT